MGLRSAHDITVYNALGEVDRRAAYKRTVMRARVERVDDKTLVIVDGSVSGFVDPEEFDGQGWTLAEGDLIARGVSTIEIPEATVADLEAAFVVLRVVSHEAITLFGRRVHHYEVTCA